MKKNRIKKPIVYYMIYLGLLTYFEIILRFFTLNKSMDLLPFVFNLWYALLLTLISFSFKHTRIVFYSAVVMLTFIWGSQVYYYYFFDTFYIAYSFLRVNQVAASYYREIITLIQENLYILFLFYLPFVLLLFVRKNLAASKLSFKKIGIGLMVFTILYGATLLQITMRDKDDATYDAYVYHPEVIASVKTLGVLTSFTVDVTRLVRENMGLVNATRVPDVIDDDDDSDPGNPAAYNKLDIPFDELIKNTTNKTLIAMHEYFKSRTATRQNIKTGIYKDYNLILITAESFSHYAVRQDITPTLYKMVHQGIYIPNFYNPIWSVSTSDGEYVQFTSLIPKSGVWTLSESSVNDMGFVMGHQLKKLGYATYAFHNHLYTYYDRDKSHPNLGYTYMGVGNGLTDTNLWPQSDVTMMIETIPMFINKDKFHIYYMTVSGHPNYTWTGNMIASKNRPLVKDLPYSEYVQGYLATQIELDRALKYLLDELEKAGKLDKTLIVLSADHYPYYLKDDMFTELNNGQKIDTTFELYRSAVVIYNSKMKGETITKLVSSMDILPTISNLMGVKYESRLMMGSDIFSNQEPLIIFVDRSFITSVGRYNAKTKEFIYKKGVVPNTTYVDAMIKQVSAKFYYSQKFFENDYWKIISNSLKP
ncbi:MAG: sulfatase [Erysipelotrichaceae bacterium]|nr:MAG: sulfatase [Erysipelotrichaceae bacterium]